MKKKGGEIVAWNRLYAVYKYSARLKKLSFHLSIEEFKQLCSKNCYYCGAAPREFYKYYNNLHKIADRKKHKIDEEYAKSTIIKYNGIDRMDSNIGYIIENCVPCCTIHNYMKSKLTKKEFLDNVKQVYEFLKLGE